MMIRRGSREIRSLLIQQEHDREVLEGAPQARDVEQDANVDAAAEKVYE